MRVEFRQYLWHGLFHEVVHVDRVDILVVDDVQQVVELISACVDDIQSVARKMVCIECSYEYSNHDTYCHEKWHQSICLVPIHSCQD